MQHRLITLISLLAVALIAVAGGKKVLFIGDSITDGAWGNSKVWNTPSEERNQTDMNHIYGHGYMMIAASHYQGLYPEQDFTFWNRGISGNTLNDIAARWEKDALSLQPDVISLLVGTNDVEQALNQGQVIDPQAWGQQLCSLFDRARLANPSVQFVLCTPFVAKAGRRGEESNYPQREQMIASLTVVIQDIAQKYAAVVVPFSDLVAETISTHPEQPVSYWIWDGIHPTSAMHYRMATLWISATESLLLE